MFAGFSFNVG